MAGGSGQCGHYRERSRQFPTSTINFRMILGREKNVAQCNGKNITWASLRPPRKQLALIFHSSINIAPNPWFGLWREHDSSFNPQWAIFSSIQCPLSRLATRTTAALKTTKLFLDFLISYHKWLDLKSWMIFTLTPVENKTLWSTLKTERLLYDYGVHVGRPPISQIFILNWNKCEAGTVR